MDNKNTGFCTSCDTQIKSFEGLTACPTCGTTGVPCDYTAQVDVSINWQELRILVMWAERWYDAKVAPEQKDEKFNVVFAIAERLRRQHPKLAKSAPLTMASEVQAIVDKYGPNVQHNVPGVEGGKPLGGNA